MKIDKFQEKIHKQTEKIKELGKENDENSQKIMGYENKMVLIQQETEKLVRENKDLEEEIKSKNQSSGNIS